MTSVLTSPPQPGPWPLVVALHGWKAPAYEPSRLFGVSRPLPCHFLAPWTSAPSWEDEARDLVHLIHSLANTPQVDRRRLYLVGFSMGGSGTYQVANAYQKAHGGCFAALVRVAGQSEPALAPEIGLRTAVWHHVGTQDTPWRVAMARRCFRSLRGSLLGRGTKVETWRDRTQGYPRVTKVLYRDGREQARLSLYQGLGHDDGVPFTDPQLLPWLFSQSLSV